ncbi:centrosomal protein of 104 kDa-like isoform X2 [Dreissena polymorpha]|uniref:centrosomal protein of 104 kDa-like isoform X2 n=1 Tax=Dreissena polymorpha TaxID=45954 RepID=UPI0022645EB6|nr:centrosomal protein of 104 kDa-like isoform X2 [Dreissena polymorpha]
MPHKLAFKVTHASGQDEVHRASELNYHSPLTKGWQSARYCLYPQDIVVQLEKRSRLRKIQVLSHQYLIATRIEFFVGDVPDGMPVDLDNARYTRLGYVSLSDNEKTGFKARELKSVQVDAVGVFLKLNIHKNHINKYNMYNQVGLVAVNVIGDKVQKGLDALDELDLFSERKKVLDDPSLEGLYDRPDYISPLDDLAFDMYQDPEIAQIIRKLEKKKQEAVLQERYEYAKKLKHTIQELQKVGEKLGKYEVEKRQAVENEDYDKAKLKKAQMDEYRLQIYRDLNVHDLMETTGSRHPQKIDLESIRHPASSPPLFDLPRTPPSPPPRTPYDERVLPAVKSQVGHSPLSPRTRTPYDERPLPIHNREPATTDNADNSPRTPYDERPLPVGKKIVSVVEEEVEPPPPESAGGGITGEPEPLSEKDLREASAAIDIFGEPLVSKAYSKTWSYREDALLAVYKQMQELPTSGKQEAKDMLRASLHLMKRAIDDKVYAVFKAGLMLLKMILTEYIPKHKLPKSDTTFTLEKTLPNLLHKSGDTAVRNRDDAKNFILECASMSEVKPTMVVPHECVKPWKGNPAPRLAQSRGEIVETLYEQLGIKDSKSGLTVDNMMNFCVVALNHTSADVRVVAERIVKALYKEVGQPVKDYLPADDEKSRKNTMWRLLFEYFDKIDGKPSKSDVKRQKADEEARKQQEIEGLQRQLQQLKDMASGKAPVDESVLEKKPAVKKPLTNKPKSNKPVTKGDEGDETSVYNMDNICIFCGEKNPTFTEEGLDLHYWKNCPMLKRCANCKQVVEIASYTDHLLTECEAKANYAKCPRCTEAIPKPEHEGHVAEKACNAAKAGTNHCPLCHQNHTSGEDGWKNHLMGKDGCKQNPRRLLALNKQPPAGKAGATTSRAKPAPRLPKKTPR